MISWWLEPLRAALSFLTVLPVGGGRPLAARHISHSRAFYPAVGLLVGLLLVGLERGASLAFPPPLTAAILLAALAAATRALHLDGLMDICDGVFGGHTRERRLEIMQDSRVGAFGVAGGVVILLWKYAALLSLLTAAAPGGWAAFPPGDWAAFPHPDAPPEAAILPGLALLGGGALADAVWWGGVPLWAALLLFPALSRWAMVAALLLFPYARRGGLGSPFHQGGARTPTLLAAIAAAAAALLLAGLPGLALLAGISLLAAAVGWALSRALGGLTGDAYGAINELAETAALTALAAAVS